MLNNENSSKTLSAAGLRVTPQRLAIIGALYSLRIHPTAEQIAEFLKADHPSLSFGTIYSTLEKFVEKGIAVKISTGTNVMRYDICDDAKHHHLYSAKDNKIGDYYDDELNVLLKNYFRDKEISGFKVADVRLEIIGEFV